MASDRKTDSCKTNGAKAAANRTPEGVDRSKLNALKHGLTAQTLILPGESNEMFQEFAEAIRSSVNPRTLVQQILVHNLVTAAWRQRRFLGYETSVLVLAEEEMRDEVDKKWIQPSPQTRSTLAFQKLVKDGQWGVFTRYDSHLDHQLHRAMKALQNQPLAPEGEVLPSDANPENEHQPQTQSPADLPAFLAEETRVASATENQPIEPGGEIPPNDANPENEHQLQGQPSAGLPTFLAEQTKVAAAGRGMSGSPAPCSEYSGPADPREENPPLATSHYPLATSSTYSPPPKNADRRRRH